MSNIIDQATKIVEANGFKDRTYHLDITHSHPFPSLLRQPSYFSICEGVVACRGSNASSEASLASVHASLRGSFAPDPISS